MLLPDFLESINGELHKHKSKLSTLFAKVVKQSIRHTTRSEMEELYKIKWPSEDPVFTQWRKDNRRHITVDIINQFVRMLQRTMLATLKFDYDYPELERFISEKIIPLAIQDPNTVIIHWPFIEGVEGPPHINGDNTTQLTTEKRIIYSFDLVEKTDELVIYNYDTVVINKTKHKRFIGIDKKAYYILEPFYDTKKILKYRAEIWYQHNFNLLPIIELFGINTNHYDESNIVFENPIPYKESLAWPAFENFDEAVMRLSSEQVASAKHANPKLVMNGDIKCPACGGLKVFHDENKKARPCGTCNGTGNLSNLGDFSTVKIENGKTEFDKSHDNPLFYLNPPEGLVELKKSWKEFIEDGKKALVIDILENTGNESGIAKEMRLEPKQDLLKSFGTSICYFVEDFINFKRLLEGNTKLISVTPPVYYQTQNPDILKLEITASLPGERYIKFMNYIDSVYKGDEITIKINRFAVLYAPLVLYKPDEIDTAFNAGAYDEKDIKKRDMAIYAMTQIVTKNPNIELKEAKEAADKLLIDEGFLSEGSNIGQA